MKLLVDENLAPKLAANLADLFFGSIHVSSAELGSTPDEVVWEYAMTRGFTILTKDKDFASLSLVRGAHPKVIPLQTGNCSAATIEGIVRNEAVRISDFEHDGKRNLLILKVQ